MKKFKPPSLILASSLFFSSCGVYSQKFECRPPKGLGCVPASEVCQMIVEKSENENDPFDNTEHLFLPETNTCH